MKPNEMSVRDYMAMNFACAEIIAGCGISHKELRANVIKMSYALADEMLEYGKQTEPKEDYKAKVIERYFEAKAVKTGAYKYAIQLDGITSRLAGTGATEDEAWQSAYEFLSLKS
jgi:hypothetical protein